MHTFVLPRTKSMPRCFRLASRNLPIVTNRFPGGQLFDRTEVRCGGRAFADKLHVVCDCTALRPLRKQCATGTDTMSSCSIHKDHMQVSTLFQITCIF